MANCCTIEIRNKQILKTLWIVLYINLIVFFIQFTAAIIANSSSLLADSFDMMGDFLAYAISIYAFNKGEKWGARASFVKGIIILLLAAFVLFDVIKQIYIDEALPTSSLMLIFSLIGLCANSLCLWLLSAYQNESINMKSVWICSRNDILVNISVFITAILVYIFQSRWPDVIVGLALALVLIHSSFEVLKLSIKELNK